jgi:molecular chaperone HscB
VRLLTIRAAAEAIDYFMQTSSMIDLSQDYFALFGLERRYRIDEMELDAAYRALQSAVHPDRFVNADDAERRMSLQSSARVNEAYRVLRDPVDRAQYLLSLNGIDAPAETDNALPFDFLEEQLERREAVADAQGSGDETQLDALLTEVRLDLHAREGALGQLLDDEQDWENARASVRELRFLHRLAADIDRAAAELEQ